MSLIVKEPNTKHYIEGKVTETLRKRVNQHDIAKRRSYRETYQQRVKFIVPTLYVRRTPGGSAPRIVTPLKLSDSFLKIMPAKVWERGKYERVTGFRR